MASVCGERIRRLSTSVARPATATWWPRPWQRFAARASGWASIFPSGTSRNRAWQPRCLVNDRLVKGNSTTPVDIVTEESAIPPAGLRDAAGRRVRWEACMTLNLNWGYSRDDRAYKPPAAVLAELVEIVGKGGNLLLNVGPNARGEFPAPWYPETFATVGRWLELHAASIYGARPVGLNFGGGQSEPHPWFYDNFRWKAFYTQRDRVLYVHIVRYPEDRRLCLPTIDGHRIAWITLVADGTALRWDEENFLNLKRSEATVHLPRHPHPDGVTTLAVELEPLA